MATTAPIWFPAERGSHFHRDEIAPLRHKLLDDPRFERASLLRLAESLGDVGHWRGRCPWTEEVHLVKKHYKAEVSLAQAILRADEVDAYVYMNDVQRDPEFATLVDACFSCLQALTEAQDPGMHDRRGWIILSSPNSNCPYHRDADTIALLQLEGKKRLYAWDPYDESVCSQVENETLLAERSQARTVFRDELLAKAQVFDLEPGDGVYLPFSAPHVVEVPADTASLALSLTYVTRYAERLMGVQRMNRRLRRLGLRPRGPPRAASLGDPACRITLLADGVLERLRTH